MSKNGNFFRFTVWLPQITERDGDGRVIALNADLSGWASWFAQHGIETEIRRRGDGKVSLYREGEDAFQGRGEGEDDDGEE